MIIIITVIIINIYIAQINILNHLTGPPLLANSTYIKDTIRVNAVDRISYQYWYQMASWFSRPECFIVGDFESCVTHVR